MSRAHVVAFTALAMLAFAANSILCRLALGETRIDAASFTLIRLVSGAVTLWVIVRARGGTKTNSGDWTSAGCLFAYAAAFSYAYQALDAGTGALVLFGAVQATMLCAAIARGERMTLLQSCGLALALGGLIGLVLPGVTAPPLPSAMLMAAAGIAWGLYSLRGRKAAAPIATTAGNFARASVPAAILGVVALPAMEWDMTGAGYALLSGALASALGYVLWYSVLPALRATQAATLQLSVPVLAALGGVILLGETVTLRLSLSAVAVLGGIAVVLRLQHPGPASSRHPGIRDEPAPDRQHSVKARSDEQGRGE